MTRDDIAAVMAKIPELNAFGIGLYCDVKRAPEAARQAWVARERDELSRDVDGCTGAAAWLETLPRLKRINNKISSYGLKHIYEEATGNYVTNGAFIAAAVHLGLKYRISPDSPNVLFNVSVPKVKP